MKHSTPPPNSKNTTSSLKPLDGAPHHNALQQVHLEVNGLRISGFSISGLSSYIQMPDLNLCFDMGECPLSAIGLNHVFLTHAHGDHSRCLLRHHSLRKMMNIKHEAHYYLPASIYQEAKDWIKYEAIFQGVKAERVEYPQLEPVTPGTWIPFGRRADLVFKAFPVRHTIPSLGYTVAVRKKKLKEEYLGYNREQIIALRESGTEITRDVFETQVTFIGDCTGASLVEQSHIWQSPLLIIECTFIDDDEINLAAERGHTHLRDIIAAYQKFASEAQTQTIILKHFSMKYPRKFVFDKINRELPTNMKNLVKIFL